MAERINISLIGTAQVDDIWPRIKGYFRTALTFGSHNLTLPDLYIQCRSGRAFLFVADDLSAALVVIFELRNNGLTANIRVFGGVGPVEWGAWIDRILQFAKENGATHAIAVGRKGLEKVLPKRARVTHVTYEMEL